MKWTDWQVEEARNTLRVAIYGTNQQGEPRAWTLKMEDAVLIQAAWEACGNLAGSAAERDEISTAEERVSLLRALAILEEVTR